MSEIAVDGATRIWWTSAGGKPGEIPDGSVKITMQRVEPERTSFYSGTVLVFRSHNAPAAKALWDWAQAVRLRRRRMHSAYSRRRGRGRW
jgi:hypothetical protein